VVICGGGVVGLTVARRLAKEGMDVLLIEKEEDFGLHASGRNSGVLHAGIYYAPDSLKARFSIEGNRRMREFVKEKGLPINEHGKVIVAKDEEDLERLLRLYDRARRNGAKVFLIDEVELKDVEPQAKTYERAIFSPNTAVINPQQVMEALAEDVLSTGRVRVMLGVRCLGRVSSDKVKTTVGNVSYKLFINAAGVYADRLAHFWGVGFNYRIVPFKGTYRRLKDVKVLGNVYPVPHPKSPFLGVHFTHTPSGEVIVGPTAIPAFGREHYGLLRGIDFEAPKILLQDSILLLTNPLFKYVALREPRKYVLRWFYESCRWMVEDLKVSDLKKSDRVGIRAQLIDWKSKELIMDFVVEKAERSVHILNAVSPAFTASLPFADHIFTMVKEYLN